jgi:hypothetical protein
VPSTNPGYEIKPLATGLAAGIIFDPTVIRALPVPALMRLLGDANWWMPASPFASPAHRLRRSRPRVPGRSRNVPGLWAYGRRSAATSGALSRSVVPRSFPRIAVARTCAELSVVRVRGRRALAWCLGRRGALRGGDLAVDLGLVALIGCPAALLGLAEALKAFAFAGLGGAFALVGAALALVGLALALVGDALTLVRDALAPACCRVARFGSTRTLGEVAVSPLEFELAAVFVVGRASLRRAEHGVQCSRLSPRDSEICAYAAAVHH